MAAGHRNWWFPTVHILTLIIGAGILGLPAAMVHLGWCLGMLTMAICWIITLHNLWKVLELQEHGGVEGADKYSSLGRLAWGIRGKNAMPALQLTTLVSVDISYMVTAGYGTYLVFDGLVVNPPILGIVIFAALQVLMCLIPGISELTIVSLFSMLMSFGYTAIIVGTSIPMHKTNPTYVVPKDHMVARAFNAVGEMGFAFGGAVLLSLEIQASMMSTPDKPSRIPMWHGILVSYLIIAICYFPVAGLGYWTYGGLDCFDNVLQVLNPGWLKRMANAMLVIHLTGGYQLRAIPVYETMESWFPIKLHPSWISRLIIRSTFIASTAFIAILMPFFSEIIGLIGGLTVAPSTYFVPTIIWMIVKKPERYSPSWLVSLAWIAFGIFLWIVAIIGSIWSLAAGLNSRHHRLFHFPHKKNCSLSA